MESSRFNRIFLVLVLMGLLVSAVLALVRFGSSDNDLILRYQLSKVDRLASGRALDFVVLGDSSAGNGVSAEVLRALSGAKVENFALTGSFGLAGDLYLIKSLHERHGVGQFVLIHSPDIWNRGLQQEAVFKLLPVGSLSDYDELIAGGVRWEFFKYLLNPQRLAEAARTLYGRAVATVQGKSPQYWIASDFLAQRDETFSNGSKRLDARVEWKQVSPQKRIELRLLSDYCSERKLTCVMLVGPVHEAAYVDLQARLDGVFAGHKSNRNFRIDTEVHAFPEAWMGDTIDHVDLKWKPEATRIYWASMARYLRNCGEGYKSNF